MGTIQIRNARLHNLKDITLSIPKGQFVVITGVSGSGKSSLAFDLIYAEGRRRYLQLLGEEIPQEREVFDEIRGLSPTVAVEQRILRQSNPRSTVGTRTKLQGSLALLFALGGKGRDKDLLPPAVFSPNAAQGMCLKCYGRGVVAGPAYAERIVQELEGESPLIRKTPRMLRDSLRLLAAEYHFDVQGPFRSLSADAQRCFLYGCGRTSFEGLVPFSQRVNRAVPDSLIVCPSCHGYRLGPDALSVTIGGMHIGQVANLTLAELDQFLSRHAAALAEEDQQLASVVESMRSRIGCLLDVGLSHLSLWRSTPTLSGGELQHLFLATYLNTDMNDLLFVFDEPSTGLHELEKRQLIHRLRQLQSLGNSVLVVEHDPAFMQAADSLIEIGPGPGRDGGQVVYQGDYAGYLDWTASAAVKAVDGNNTARARSTHPITAATPRLTLHGVRTNNLKRVTVSLPLGVLVGIAGVSGSGKSTLIAKTLVPLLQARLSQPEEERHPDWPEDEPPLTPSVDGLTGWEAIRRVAAVTQLPIGRQKSSTPASYIGVWDPIRALFAEAPLAQENGFTAADFSFNAAGGCPACGGEGTVTTYISGYTHTQVCGACQGRRYRPDVLAVTYRGMSIADVLTLTVSDSVQLFAANQAVSARLQILCDVGLGYLTLGQPSTTLSGGEAQRVKLARELGGSRPGPTLYVLDEPTAGLSATDVTRLLHLLGRLVDRGASVILIEHDRAVLSACDWIVELGPGSGAAGGEVMASGTPADLALDHRSLIGPFLGEC